MIFRDKIVPSKKEVLFSFEILPPQRSQNIESLYSQIDPILALDPLFIAVTYHRDEYIFHIQPNGQLKRTIKKKRPGTIGISATIKNKYKIEVLAHIICAGFSAQELENMLIELNYLNINNVLVLRGDKAKKENNFTNVEGGYLYASDLLEQISNMKKGVYLDGSPSSPHIDFCLGVAGYPEKHEEAVSLEEDVGYLKKKVDRGAEFIITQMFFDNAYFFQFVKKCREIGIHVPIIPGIKPIQKKRHIEVLPKIFQTRIPEVLKKEITACKTDKEVEQVGIQWGIQQSIELKKYGVPCIHYFSMGKSHPIEKIIKTVF